MRITQFDDGGLPSITQEKRPEAIASGIAQITTIDALYAYLRPCNISTGANNEERIWDAVLPKTVEEGSFGVRVNGRHYRTIWIKSDDVR